MKLSKPCREWSRGRFRQGYGARYFQGRHMGAHRAAWIEAYGPIPAGLFVLHRCDNPPCYELSHLFLGTNADNSRDAIEKGRTARGRRHGSCKLSDNHVREIRRRRMAGEKVTDLATEYGVSIALISLIASGKKRAFLGREPYTPPPPDRTRQVHAELIRILYDSGYTQGALGVMFGISQPQISNIVNGRRRRISSWS